MSIGPLLPGRFPNALLAQRLQANMQRGQTQLAKVQQQIATGVQFVWGSESPAAASRTLNLQTLLERKAQAASNLRSSQSLLTATDAALTTVSDALNRGRVLLVAGVGSTATAEEKRAMAVEVESLVRQVVNAGNAQFGGRFLFGGTQADAAPFSIESDGTVRYGGDRGTTQSLIDLDRLLENNLHGVAAFDAVTPGVGGDLDPALTWSTRLADLNSGRGIVSGTIRITVDDGVAPQQADVDLAGAVTLQDVKGRIEAAFAAGPLTVSVGIDPVTKSALTLTPSAGTIAVADVDNGRTAADLGIRAAASASITGSDVDAAVTLATRLADLHRGAGIAATSNGGLLITNGSKSGVVDVSSAQTVEELFNLLEAADLDLELRLDPHGRGLAIASRLSGASFSIAENGETTAADLGLKTFHGGVRLADLNFGVGVPLEGTPELRITRRNGAAVTVDLAGAATVQDVVDRINLVDPGNLVASYRTVGNGLRLVDNSGSGPLSVEANPVGAALGLSGTESSGNPLAALEGRDVNPLESRGTISLLVRLAAALRDGNDRDLERLNPLFDAEIGRMNRVRGEIGGRQQTVDDALSRIQDQSLQLQESLSLVYDTDMARAITELSQIQLALEATLQSTARTMSLSLLAYL